MTNEIGLQISIIMVYILAFSITLSLVSMVVDKLYKKYIINIKKRCVEYFKRNNNNIKIHIYRSVKYHLYYITENGNTNIRKFKTADSRDKFILKKIYKDKNRLIDYIEINHYK